ncbi:MAG: hypothetical protein WC858_05910 [Parcubacteria group bacterium]|jgi:glucan phosphoethanolaminetransferase (alkaline phosphatase superfamily)
MIILVILAIIAFVFFAIISLIMIELHRSYKKKEPVYTSLAVMWLIVITVFAIAYFSQKKAQDVKAVDSSEKNTQSSLAPTASPNLW